MFRDVILKEFWESFSVWELETVLEYCKRSHISSDSATSPGSPRTLLDAPVSIVLLMLSNLTTLRDPRIITLIRSHVPDKPILGWPLDAPPAGLFLLLMDESPEVRRWAYQQVARYAITPMPLACFVQAHVEALEATVNAVSSPGTSDTSQPWSPGFTFPSDPAVLWPGFCTMLRFVPPERIKPDIASKIDLRSVIVAHLSDVGNRQS